MNAKPGRLAVGVVGAGRVGAVLGSALRAVGHELVGVSGSSPATLERIETMLPGVPVLDMVEVARAADLLLITVPDDDIAPVTAWLAQQGALRAGQIVVHASGRHGLAALRPAVEAGAIPLAIHPAMTFTGTSMDLVRIVGAPFAVTAPAPVLPIGQALVVEIGGEPVLLSDDARPAYHAALSHASNHLVTLLVQAEAVLAEVGVDDPARLLGPLTRASLEGALSSGGAALTGPVSRGDRGTVSDHLTALAALPDELATAASYRALAAATALLARETGRLSEADAAAITVLLREHEGAAELVPPDAAAAAVTIPVIGTVAELRTARSRLAGTVAVVMTMGALHPGHLSLVRAARSAADHVIVTVFVNPTQFGDPADLERYPRTLGTDLELLASLVRDAPDLVFAPTAQEMYPDGVAAPGAGLVAGPAAAGFEGGSRAGHFDGVVTVVAKLLHLTRPDVAVFGQKDAQQLAVVRAMVRALDEPVWILAAPIVRDADGLALSSRNARLSPAGRTTALALSRAVGTAQRLASAGASREQVEAAARAELDVPGLEVDYAAVVDADTFAPARDGGARGGGERDGGARDGGERLLVVAAVVEGVRLLDNGLLPVDGQTPPAR